MLNLDPKRARWIRLRMGILCGAMGIAFASLKNQPSTGVRKMRASIRNRIGRGLAAISSTGSTKLTWLQTTMAAPVAGMFSSPRIRKR